MKSCKVFIVPFLLLVLFLMCGKKNSTGSEDRPPACDISGSWSIIITVTGGNQLPTGTEFTAVLVLRETEDGDVTGSITMEGGLTAEVTGTLSDINLDFKIKQDSPCIGTFKGTGTINENCAKLSGSYSGDDCNGTMKANFISIGYIPYITGSVTDIDGNTYQTVKIGNQWWMAENLKVTHYRNGWEIPKVTDSEEWANSYEAYCAYGDESHTDTYGYLYNWYALMIDAPTSIAPEGWHVPSDEEWQILVDYLGGDNSAGGKLKEAGTMHWLPPNLGATNESNFTALPGGYREINNSYFYDLGNSAHFWSSTAGNVEGYMWCRIFYNYNQSVLLAQGPKRMGMSVRLVKD